MVVVKRQMKNCSAISWRELVTFWWDDDDDDILFGPEHNVELDFYSATSLKQQYEDWNVILLGHIILIPDQPDFALIP